MAPMQGSPGEVDVRDYRDEDEPSWLRARVLSFLSTAYYDDVKTERTRFDGAAVRLVAVRPGPGAITSPGAEEVVGLLDVELFDPEPGAAGGTATIDSIAVHPDHQRRGLADRLLAEALRRLAPLGLVSLDAWTREDGPANHWYLRNGFAVAHEYLHVYKSWDDPAEGFTTPDGLSAPLAAFMHGSLEDEQALRARFRRVHRCRQYLREL